MFGWGALDWGLQPIAGALRSDSPLLNDPAAWLD